MQLPLEMLSNTTTGTGSGIEFGLRNTGTRSSPGNHNNSFFARVIDTARQTQARQTQGRREQTREAPEIISDEELNDRFINPRYMLPFFLFSDEEEPDATLAAGVIENQMVVSILEGDKESATTPQTFLTITESTEIIYRQEGIEEKPVTSMSNTQIQFTENTFEEYITTGIDAQADITELGEVTARTPNTEVSQQNISSETNSKSSDFGDLSPLENENDTAPVKEQYKMSNNESTDDKSREKETEQPTTGIHAPITDEGIRPQRLSAEEQLKSAALNPPVKPENLFEEMVQRVDVMKTDSARTMTIQLNPHYLGEVALELISTAAGLSVRIEAANPDVRTMINGQITALIESLEHKGIEIVGVEVTHTGIDIGAFNKGPTGDNANSSNSSGRNNGYRREMKPEKLDYYTGLKIDIAEYYLDAGVSSVEFSA